MEGFQVKATPQIFISYAREDEEKVQEFYQKLSDAGFKPWMDKEDIVGGERWKSRIPQAIRRSDFFLACMSANSVTKRGWIQKEIRDALDIWQEKLDSDIYLIPVRLEDCEVPESLCDFQWVDLFKEEGWTRLVEAIQVGIDRRIEITKPIPKKGPAQAQTVGPEYILTVGSGTTEYILRLDSDVQLGRKHIVNHRDELLGGSGVNYTLRLVNAGFSVFPILSIGKDQLGRRIRDEILASAQEAGLPKQALTFIKSDEFLADNIKTPRSTIIVEKAQRTIFTEPIIDTTIDENEYPKHYKDYMKRRLTNLDKPRIKAVMIGHIYADSPDLNRSDPGECTRYIIQTFRDECFVFANFGDSQIRMGAGSWENDLKGVSVFQLNLYEMRRLFAQKNAKISLLNIIEWMKNRCITAIITLDKFGAIGTYKDREDVILAWPFELEDMVDSTGAGDAFGAGLVSQLYQKPDFSFGNFYDAIEEARIWAAYACRTLGGATNCPDIRALEDFHKGISKGQSDPVEKLNMKQADQILRILDKAYE
jgi:sugar/nucleoside kinase (ribokinase family)